MNKKYMFAMLGLFALTFASAIWLLDFSGNVVFDVTSAPVVSYVWDSTEALLDTTAGDVSLVKTLTIDNGNAQKNYNIYWNVTQTDVIDGCDDFLNDTSLIVTQGSNFQALGQGANFVVPHGLYPINFELFAKKGSCPQIVNISVQLVQ